MGSPWVLGCSGGSGWGMLSTGVLEEQPGGTSCPVLRAQHPGQPGSLLAPTAAPPVTPGVLTASVLPRRLVRRGAAAEVAGDGPDIRQHRVQVLQLQRPPAVSALPPRQPPGAVPPWKPQSLSWDTLGGGKLPAGGGLWAVFSAGSPVGALCPPWKASPPLPALGAPLRAAAAPRAWRGAG